MGNDAGSLTAGTGQQDLTAAQHKGIGRPQPLLQGLLFVLGQRTDIDGFSHTEEYTTSPKTLRGTALGLLNLGFFPPDVAGIALAEIFALVLFNACGFGLTAQDLRDFGLPADIASFYRGRNSSEVLSELPPKARWVWIFSNGLELDLTMPHRVHPEQEPGPFLYDTSLWCRSGKPRLTGIEQRYWSPYSLLHIPANYAKREGRL